LAGLNDGSITLGARKRRGFGKVKVPEWRVTPYDLTKRDGLLAWVAAERGDLGVKPPQLQTGSDLAALLKVTLREDRRRCFWMKATFALDGSLLIRSGSGQDDVGPDMVHLHARQTDGSLKPVLSGTSLAGALRARALRLAQTLGDDKGKVLVDEAFGPDLNQRGVKPKASKVSVEETVVRNPLAKLVQNRVSIDRFTGGAFETALFNQQALWGQDGTTITMGLRLINPTDSEMGLLLLLLKDLWTSDLPLGGESSVGRGRLRGRQATLELTEADQRQAWMLIGDDERVVVSYGDKAQLEGYVGALNKALSR
jgi:CRISPR/Cas system CSM-associated protein Csm3 (group 7 of RAMP superfamily)